MINRIEIIRKNFNEHQNNDKYHGYTCNCKNSPLCITEVDLTKEDLLEADEAFLCGTAAELTPINSVNDKKLPKIDISLKLQKLYFDAVNGKSEKHKDWLTFV